MKAKTVGFWMMFSLYLLMALACAWNIGALAALSIFGGLAFLVLWIFIATGLMVTGSWDEVKDGLREFVPFIK